MTSPARLRRLAGAALLLPLLAAPAAHGYADLESPSIFGDIGYVTQGAAAVELSVHSDQSGHIGFSGNEAIVGDGNCTGGPDSGTCGAAGVGDVFVGLNAAANVLDAGNLSVAHVVARLGAGADRFIGTAQGDTVVAGDGDDEIRGGAGPDVIADAGYEILDGGSGAGVDTLRGEDGADVFLQGPVPNADTITGGAGRDRIDYSTRTTAVIVAPEADTGDGQEGEDDAIAGVEDVIAGAGDDELTGADANNQLTGGPGDDVLRGGAGSDLLRGGTLSPSLGSGDDVYDGGPGADQFVLSDGTDTLSYRSQPEGVRVTVDGIPGDGNAFGENVPAGFEVIEGGAGPDVLAGHATLGDDLRGLAGADSLLGGGGADVLDPGAGVDAADGESGDDRILARDGAVDTVACGSGTDIVVADAGDVVAADCETVERDGAAQSGDTPPGGTPGGGGATPPAGGGTTPSSAPSLAILSKRVRRDARGRVRVRLACGATAPCTGRLTLRAKGRRAGGRAYALAAGETRRVRVRIAGSPRRVKVAATLAGGAPVALRLAIRRR
jgi:Ca2+-binding RTX toxin-like protein